MIDKCLLETDGYLVLFDLKNLDSSQEYFDLIVDFQLDSRIFEFSIKSIPSFIAIKDLYRLVTYFEEHIANLQKDPNSESYTFITWELGFQLQAQSGDVDSPNDGEFGLLFMINVGRSHEQASRTYVGGESTVTVENARKFTSSLQAVLAQLSDSRVTATSNG
ncbi:hypothetical protein [Argonema galeatum]|uniref:hypothetical protein n=1 Tax=Argonema galeatum TaxID=2942762 RepID=UPI002011385F|nr:hypothetical protein [Argonema galeatum]MCL1467721.1 hypothetical protein [Argonema galeatum A003/A1]